MNKTKEEIRAFMRGKCVHISNDKDLQSFYDICSDANISWPGSRLVKYSLEHMYGLENTMYIGKHLQYGSMQYATRSNHTILTFKDFERFVKPSGILL
jgi:hypothetical protein